MCPIVPTIIDIFHTINVGFSPLEFGKGLHQPIGQKRSSLDDIFQHPFPITTKLFITMATIMSNRFYYKINIYIQLPIKLIYH